MNFNKFLLHCQLSTVIVWLVFLSNNLVISENANQEGANNRPERSAETDTFTLGTDDLFFEQPASQQNGTRKVARALSANQRSQRSSSFRLEDNGSKLHYLRTNHNDMVAGRNDMDRLMQGGSADTESESGALFCYYQSVQVGYELGPSVTKCTIPGHDACMLLENTRSGVREMSCISASDCELTRVELLRSKADGSVRLTCCQNNLCNAPASNRQKSSGLPSGTSNTERNRATLPQQPKQPAASPQQRSPALRDRHPLHAPVEEPTFTGLDSPFAGRGPLVDMANFGQLQFVGGQQPASARNSRNGARSAASLSNQNLRQASSLLERAQSRAQKVRTTTSSPYWNNMPGAFPSGAFDGNNAQDSDPAIASMISRVLGGRGGNVAPQQPKQQNQFPSGSRANRPASPYAQISGDPNKQPQQQQATEQDLYQQMMLLLGNEAKSQTNQRQRASAVDNMDQRSGLLAASVCDFPPLMPNAWVSVASLEVGSEVYYQCSPGYQLDGPRVVTCTEHPTGTTASPLEGRLAEKILHAHPRWTQVPTCVRASDMNQLGDKMATSMNENELAAQMIMSKSASQGSQMGSNVISDHFKHQLPVDYGASQTMSPPVEMSMPYAPGAGMSDENEPAQGNSALDTSSDSRRESPSDRVTQCYDNRAGSVFVASCRGDSVICTRIVTTGSSAMSLLSSSESGASLSPYGSESGSQALSDSMPGNSRSSSGQQQQVSQYCALLDDCLRFERWVRLANRDDIDVLCCSTDLCNA